MSWLLKTKGWPKIQQFIKIQFASTQRKSPWPHQSALGRIDELVGGFNLPL